jgi:hypothetical protein
MWTLGILSSAVLLGSVAMRQTAGATGFVESLVAKGPLAEQREKMDLYNDLIGGWDVEVIDHASDDTRKISKGEWYFAWTLDGRAIQDVFIVPTRLIHSADPTAKFGRYGTSIRTFDSKTAKWNITWINPVSGAFDRLIGEKRGSEIYQEGTNSDGSLMRWIFSDVTGDSFRWRGEKSTDGGETWTLGAEFFGRRRKEENSHREERK